MQIVASLVVALMLAACAHPVKVREAEPVAAHYAPPADGLPAGTAVFVRDAGLAGAMNDLIVMADGKRVGTLRPGQKVTIRMAAGLHVVGIGCSPCSDSFRKEIQHVIEPGKTSVFRLEFFDIQPSTQLD